MKANIIVASAIGAVISAVLLVLEPLTDYALLSLELPGVTAAYFFWGAVGGPAFAGIAIALVVNAVVYGAAAFGVLTVFKLPAPPSGCRFRAPISESRQSGL